MSDDQLGWGIVGPGQIARVFADAITEGGVGRVVGVTGGRPGRAEALASLHGARVAPSTTELARMEAVEAVYVATPHPFHRACVLEALAEGKPVLCEKPLTDSWTSTSELRLEWSADHDVPLLEGWMYRTHPQIDRLLARIEGGDIGQVQRIESSFGFEASYDPSHRLFDPALGGGAILDVGGYPASFALLTSRAGLHVEDRIVLLEASLELAPTGVDQDARARFRLGDVEAVLQVSTARELGRIGRVIGDRGTLELEDPFLPEGHRRGRVGRLIHVDEHGRRTEETVESELDCFALEARAFTEHVRDPEHRCPRNMIPIEMSVEIARLCADWLEAGRNEP